MGGYVCSYIMGRCDNTSMSAVADEKQKLVYEHVRG